MILQKSIKQGRLKLMLLKVNAVYAHTTHTQFYLVLPLLPPNPLKAIISEDSHYKKILPVFSYNGRKKEGRVRHIDLLFINSFAKINPGTLLPLTKYPGNMYKVRTTNKRILN